MRQVIRATMLLLLTATMAHGADFHLLPKGQGDQDGRDWANAAPPGAIRTLLADRVEPGDRVLLGSGVFHVPRNPGGNTLIPAPRGGAESAPVTILGVDTGEGRPRIEGRWSESNPSYHAHCSACFSFGKGVSHVVLEGIDIEGFMHGVSVAGDNADLTFRSVAIERCREGFTLKDTTDSAIEDCSITRYTKRGVRFESGCRRLTLKNVSADATAGDAAWPTEAFPFGFSIEGDPTNGDIQYVGCAARNNLFESEPNKYWNGDGFVAESGVSGVSYEGCLSVNNMDGGWDDKSTAARMTDCIAIGNKRAFRVWNRGGDGEQPTRLVNCVGAYSVKRGGSGGTAGLWTCAAVEAERCTFHGNPSTAVLVENNATAGSAVLRDCILSRNTSDADSPLVRTEQGTVYEAEDVIEWTPGADVDSPDYVADDPMWEGSPVDALNSRRYGPAKGTWREEK